MPSVTLTAVATAAAQYLHVLDSGESLSTQQLSDALAAVNNLLDNLTTEQVKQLQAIVPFFTLAAGSYTPGSTIQFPDTTTPTTVPVGYVRVLELGAAIELAPQYDTVPGQSLMQRYEEARAAANPLSVRIASLVPREIVKDQASGG
jgi:hypothetical protein